ncbi:MAG TPA: hypothetical protein VG368_06780, partial [Acidimicrobiales bacterium]|nr:hypothetical protein [Acidimicrobiales bacterium]
SEGWSARASRTGEVTGGIDNGIAAVGSPVGVALSGSIGCSSLMCIVLSLFVSYPVRSFRL